LRVSLAKHLRDPLVRYPPALSRVA
jgi:hypothetical protein